MTSPPMLMVDGADLRRGRSLQEAVKDLSGQWYATMGMDRDDGGLGLATTAEAFASVPQDEPWVMAAVNRIVEDVQAVPLVCWGKAGEGKALVRPEDSHDGRQQDIQDLLDNVNQHSMSGADLKAWHVLSELTWGEDYWLKVRGKLFGGAPQELHWLRPANIEPLMRGTPWIQAYRYTAAPDMLGGPPQMTEYSAADVIASRTPNVKDPKHGLSPLKAIRYDISVDRQATMLTAYTLANWGMPATAWVAPKGADISSQDQSAIRRVLRALRGPKAGGRSAILPEGIEPKILSLNPKDAEWRMARKDARMTITAVLGVPLVLAGDDDKNTVYASLRDAERVYWRHLIPKLDRWANVLNFGAPVSLLDEFGRGADLAARAAEARSKYQIGFDYSVVEALRPELTAEMNAYAAMIDRETVTPNEARRHFAFGPDKLWGDDPLRSTRLIQEPPDALPPGAPQVEVGVVSQVPVTPGGVAQPLTPQPGQGLPGLHPPVAPPAVPKGFKSADSDDIAQAVLHPLQAEYPAKLLGWVSSAKWKYDPTVAISDIDTSQPPQKPEIIKAIEAQLATGALTDPVVLLKIKGDPLLHVADGRHRVAAYAGTGHQTIAAYIAKGAPEGVWKDMWAAKAPQPPTKELYRLDAVKAWVADQTQPIDAVAQALGVAPSDRLRVGLQRRYSAEQLWNGVPAEGFRGLKESD